jgi:hypothetical protein
MAVNSDPRPGRWLLPLVILGMVLFTYVFVQALPAADSEGNDLSTGAETTTTTVPDEDTTTTSTTEAVVLDPSVQAFLDLVDSQEIALTGFQTEMATINGQWDAAERTVTYPQTEAALSTSPPAYAPGHRMWPASLRPSGWKGFTPSSVRPPPRQPMPPTQSSPACGRPILARHGGRHSIPSTRRCGHSPPLPTKLSFRQR